MGNDHIFGMSNEALKTKALKLYGVADGLEGIIDLLTKSSHDRNSDDGSQSENNRILNKPRPFPLGANNMGYPPFILTNGASLD